MSSHRDSYLVIVLQRPFSPTTVEGATKVDQLIFLDGSGTKIFKMKHLGGVTGFGNLTSAEKKSHPCAIETLVTVVGANYCKRSFR